MRKFTKALNIVFVIRKIAAVTAKAKITVELGIDSGSIFRKSSSALEGRLSPLTRLNAIVPHEAKRTTPRRSSKARIRYIGNGDTLVVQNAQA